MQTRLTDASIKKLKPHASKQVDYWDQILKGFGLRVSPGGTKTYMIQYRKNGGHPRRLKVARYGEITLENARKKAGELLNIAQEGRDPAKAKQEEKRKNQVEANNTFSAVRDLFLDEYVSRQCKPKTAYEYKTVLNGNDFADWSGIPVSKITRRDVKDLLRKITKRGAPTAANRTLAYLRKMMNWCADEEIITTPPTYGVKAPNTEKARERVLSPDELHIIWRSLDELGTIYGPLYKLMIATGQRKGEITGIHLKEMDREKSLWEIPSDRTKNKLPHIVPMSDLAWSLIGPAPVSRSDLLFTTTGKHSVANFSKYEKKLYEKVKALAADTNKTDCFTTGWTPHDIRRTFVTWLNENGVEPHVVEALVNHVSGSAKKGVAGVYNRAQYLQQKQAAMMKWERFLNSLLFEKTEDNIFKLS